MCGLDLVRPVHEMVRNHANEPAGIWQGLSPCQLKCSEEHALQ